MMTEQEIVSKLKARGLKDAEIPTVMQEVAAVIFAHVLAAYFPILPEAQRLEISSLRTEEVADYFKNNAASLPPFPQVQFEMIHDETWEDYFKSVK